MLLVIVFAYEALFVGDIDRTGCLHEESLARLRAEGELWSLGITLYDLAFLRIIQHRHADARALCGEAIALGQQFGDRRSIAWSLGLLAAVDAAEGRPARAARLRGAMEGLLHSIGTTVQPSYNTWIGDPHFSAVQDELGTDAYQRALAAGRAMSLSQAIDDAMEENA